MIDGVKKWYHNGLPDREDGPAVERPDGSREWYIKGQQLTEEEFLTRAAKLEGNPRVLQPKSPTP